MARLQGALDNDIHIVVQKFLEDSISPDPNSLYNALQRSNSSLKRRPKKVLQASIERVLDFIGIEEENEHDSEAELEKPQPHATSTGDIMNRSLRMALTPTAPDDSGDSKRKTRMPNGEPLPKRKKIDAATTQPPNDVSLMDIGGMDETIGQLKETVVLPLLYPEAYSRLRVKLPNGILLHGPPGCGKTMMSRALASAMKMPFVEILGPSIVSGMSGESEKAIREKFDEAKRLAPCLVFMDEVDAIAPKRETSQSQMEKRIVAQLLVCMDELERDTSKPVMVLATTNRPDSIDPALRRGGRFDTEINIGVPNEQVRQSILKAQTRNTPLADNVDFKRLAKMSAGFVGADLHDFVGKAGSWQLKRYFKALEAQMRQDDKSNGAMDVDSQSQTESIMRIVARATRPDLEEPAGFDEMALTMEAFLAVFPTITPSSKREGFATVPNVSWKDVGAHQSLREELQVAIVEPIKDPDMYATIGIDSPTGVLLWGPPGCGKTLLAKAVAAESQANFISVKGPELLSKFVGDSEAAVRRLFARARSSVPCVIFFDELDALVPRRDDSGSEAGARVVNTLLSELDGLDSRAGIYIIAATNRPDIIDDAMLRPGRLDLPLFVDLPGPNERVEILKTLIKARHVPVEDLDKIAEIGHECEGYSGADLGALLRQAGIQTLARKSRVVSEEDTRRAMKKVVGSVRNIGDYRKLQVKFGQK